MATDLDLSSCVLCGRPLDGDVSTETYGGTTVEVHGDCAADGLEGRDLASPHTDPDGDAEEDGGEPAPDEGPSDAAETEDGAAQGPEPEEVESGETGSKPKAEVAASTAGSEATDGDEAGDGDPDWTRITDFD